MFSFCFMYLQCTIPCQKYMQLPVWILKSGYTPYAALTHVQNWLRLSAQIILLSFMVCFRYFNTHFIFPLYFLVLCVTLLYRNNMEGSMPGLLVYANHSNFATMEWKMSTYFFSSLVEISSTFCRPFFLVMIH